MKLPMRILLGVLCAALILSMPYFVSSPQMLDEVRAGYSETDGEEEDLGLLRRLFAGARAEDDLIIELDPGMAFGTGTHETTAMCVEMIEKHYHGGSVLDVGTGSGILAIAAARLGAKQVLGVDIDPMAVQVARENVEKNSLQDIIDIREGDLVAGLDDVRCDFAVANILADVIALLAGPLKNHLAPDALFVCSGILQEREEDVQTVLRKNGYQVFDRMQKGGWVALAARVG